MKKKSGRFIGAMVILVLAAAFFVTGCKKKEEQKLDTIRIGVSLYRFDDTFISNVRHELEMYAKEYEKENDIKVNMEIVDAKENQNTQNQQVERFISLGYDVLCINLVDRADASNIIDKAMEAEVPVVFFNRQPVDEDMKRWEKLFYVGTDAKESAVLQGKILVDAYNEDKNILDLNGDGVVKYVLLEGESSHQDSLIRTEWSVQTLKNAGIPLLKITGGIANWERNQASAFMEQWLAEYPDQIELAICNNDDMALGALDAIERAGDISGIKVVGIDGTPQGIEAVKQGKMFGTVQNDKKEYAKAIFDIAAAEARKQQLSDKIELTDGKFYESHQYSVTR